MQELETSQVLSYIFIPFKGKRTRITKKIKKNENNKLMNIKRV